MAATTPDPDPFRRIVESLREYGIVPAVATAIEPQIEAVSGQLQQAIISDIDAFTRSGNPDVLPELERLCRQQVGELRRLLTGAKPGEFEFIVDAAQRRAGQRFPLEAMLQTMTCAHRVLLPWVRDAALAVASETAQVRKVVATMTELVNRYCSAMGTLFTAEYVAETRLLAESENDRRSELLGMLLDGYDESDSHVAALLRRAGYLEQRQSFCVAVAQSVDPREMQNPARARRLADALTDATRKLPGRQLIGIRDNTVLAILSDTRRASGWTAPQTRLADRVMPVLLSIGPAVVIGLSADAPSTAHIPKALQEARTALDLASVKERVVAYASIPVRQIIVHKARAHVQSALPAWVDTLIAADKKSRQKLSATLAAYADTNMNLLKAAKQLGIHPNTIYARFDRITDITGLDPKGFHALNELLLALDCRR